MLVRTGRYSEVEYTLGEAVNAIAEDSIADKMAAPNKVIGAIRYILVEHGNAIRSMEPSSGRNTIGW